MVFITTAILFFHGYLINDKLGYPKEWGNEEIQTLCFSIATVLLLPYIMLTEIQQFRAEDNKMNYFRSLWNLADIISLPLTAIVTLHYLFGLTKIDVKDLRTMAAFASSLLVAKIYDWLRLFENTAFYVQLLEATIFSIG